MQIYPEFPENRLREPKRQAELAVYRELEASGAAGITIYEARAYRDCPEVDFAVWLEGVGRIALQVKGGQYRIERGQWFLATGDGEEKKPTPAKQAWDSAMQLHDYLQGRIRGNRNPFVIPALLFSDMAPCPTVETWAGQAGIHVLFGVDRLVERLEALAADRTYFPPTSAEIAEEVELVLPGVVPAPEPADAPEESEAVEAEVPPLGAMDLCVRQVIIQHADVVNIRPRD